MKLRIFPRPRLLQPQQTEGPGLEEEVLEEEGVPGVAEGEEAARLQWFQLNKAVFKTRSPGKVRTQVKEPEAVFNMSKTRTLTKLQKL